MADDDWVVGWVAVGLAVAAGVDVGPVGDGGGGVDVAVGVVVAELAVVERRSHLGGVRAT